MISRPGVLRPTSWIIRWLLRVHERDHAYQAVALTRLGVAGDRNDGKPRPGAYSQAAKKSPMMALSMLWYFSMCARYRPPSSLSMRHVLRCAMACSTAARILLKAMLHSAWLVVSSPPGGRLASTFHAGSVALTGDNASATLETGCSDGADESSKDRREPMLWIAIQTEFIVAAAQVLHERMSSANHSAERSRLSPRIGLSLDLSRP